MKKKIWLASICTVFLASPHFVQVQRISNQIYKTIQQQQIEAKDELSEVQQQKLQVQEEIEASTQKIEKLDEHITKTKVSITNKEKKIARLKR